MNDVVLRINLRVSPFEAAMVEDFLMFHPEDGTRAPYIEPVTVRLPYSFKVRHAFIYLVIAVKLLLSTIQRMKRLLRTNH
jgi:hypothetical protein